MRDRRHPELVSPHNPRVKEWVSLLQKKGRLQHGKYLLEGTHIVGEALSRGLALDTLLYSVERGIPAELSRFADDPRWIAVSEEILHKCSDTQTPQAVLAVLPISSTAWSPALIKARQSTHAELIVVLDEVRDPGNLGTIMRSAAAVGADGLILGKGCADLFSPKTVRSTMGALFQLPAYSAQLSECIPQAVAAGIQVLALTAVAPTSIYEVDFRKPTWVLAGNEGSGISAGVMSLAGISSVRIPMHANSESLNAAMATTIALYEAFRQRQWNPQQS